MATSLVDCDRMIAAAKLAGVVLSVCYCQRFDPRVQRARQLLAAGALGEILGTRIVFGQLRPPEYFRAGLTSRFGNDWRARRSTAGGGVLIMNACHLLDYVSWLVDSPIQEVAACTANLGGAAEVEDSVSLSYRYEQGALGTLEATTTLIGPQAYEQVLRGRDGQLVIAPTLRVWSRRTVDGYEAGRWHTVRPLPGAAERRQYFEAFADAVLDHGAPPVTAAEGRAVQAAIEAAYRAAESGRTVTVTPPAGEALPRRA
jgi:predicted dehydrogenase